jgi:hypothetical protein
MEYTYSIIELNITYIRSHNNLNDSVGNITRKKQKYSFNFISFFYIK